MESRSSRLDYDELANDYAPHRSVHPQCLDRVVDLALSRSASSILEIGTGSGNYLCPLANQIGARVVGIDPSRAMLDHAANRCTADFVNGRAECLPFQDGRFDLVFSVDVIHHIEDRSAAAHEIHRVLKPGGTLLIATDREIDIRRRFPLARYFPDIIDIEMSRYPTESQVVGELQNAGFGQIETSSVSRYFEVDDATPYARRAFSSMHFLSQDAFEEGLRRLESDLRIGPVPAESHYTLYIARRVL